MKTTTLSTSQELSKIPGVVARWADESHGYFAKQPSEVDDEEKSSPLTRLENLTEGPLARGLQGPTQHSRDSSVAPTPNETTPAARGTPDVPPPAEEAPVTDTAPTLDVTPQYPASHHTQGPEHYHPSLTRALIPTYKGRRLEELIVDGQARFVDKAAIFVGRLVKLQETKDSLFHRFTRYGNIVS